MQRTAQAVVADTDATEVTGQTQHPGQFCNTPALWLLLAMLSITLNGVDSPRKSHELTRETVPDRGQSHWPVEPADGGGGSEGGEPLRTETAAPSALKGR